MEPLSDAKMAAYLRADNNKVHIISASNRLGAGALMAAVEWMFFPPTTPRNDLYDIVGSAWQELPMLVMSFPMIKLRDAKALAIKLRLRLVHGVPIMLMSDGQSPINVMATSRASREPELRSMGFTPVYFPGAAMDDGSDNKAVMTIENARDSSVYKTTESKLKAMFEAETRVISLLNRGTMLTPDQICQYLYR